MLSNRVRELRLAKGWTHDQLGDKLDVSRQTISSIENQRYMPSLELGMKIARLFGMTVEEVFFNDDDQS